MKLVEAIKAKFARWKKQWAMRREGFTSEISYDRWHDLRVDQRASTIRDFYKGYAYVVAVEDRGHYAYKLLYDYGPGGYKYGAHEMVEWATENCKGESRIDMKRVLKTNRWGNGGWDVTDFGDADVWFFAFTDEEDVVWFRLKWGV